MSVPAGLNILLLLQCISPGMTSSQADEGHKMVCVTSLNAGPGQKMALDKWHMGLKSRGFEGLWLEKSGVSSLNIAWHFIRIAPRARLRKQTRGPATPVAHYYLSGCRHT